MRARTYIKGIRWLVGPASALTRAPAARPDRVYSPRDCYTLNVLWTPAVSAGFATCGLLAISLADAAGDGRQARGAPHYLLVGGEPCRYLLGLHWLVRPARIFPWVRYARQGCVYSPEDCCTLKVLWTLAVRAGFAMCGLLAISLATAAGDGRQTRGTSLYLHVRCEQANSSVFIVLRTVKLLKSCGLWR
jgi:uncharacterized protein YunC (DUF1805 family)